MIPDDCALAVDTGTVAVVGSLGDIRDNHEETGVYVDDTRHLNRLQVSVSDTDDGAVGTDRGDTDAAPTDLLTQRAGPDGITTLLASPAVGSGRGSERPLRVEKRIVPAPSELTVTVTVHNQTAMHRSVAVQVSADGDFAHVFENDAFFSPRPSADRPTTVTDRNDGFELSGIGLDDRRRTTTVHLRNASGNVHVETDGENPMLVCETEVPPSDARTVEVPITFEPAQECRADPLEDLSIVDGGGLLFNRATETLSSLTLPSGVPAAGAPRFVAAFGRDALIVAFQLLPFAPTLAERVLEQFAALQGQNDDNRRLEAPGKVPHEDRGGDLTATGRTLRTPYYGTVDATPLFAGLTSAYAEWHGPERIDDDLYRAAVDAVEHVLDAADEDGLLWYEPHDVENGLTHLGWKDSSDAIAHPDGTPATPPIALCEVQAYAYRALSGMANLAATRDDERADEYRYRAESLAETFDDRFWLPEEGCYALALDSDGVIPSVSSNQGHALWSGIIPEERTNHVVDRLTSPDMLTEAGIRTFAGSHNGFDPLSYHRGSVWPHDTSLAAIGASRCGYREAARALVTRGLHALDGAGTDGTAWGFPELIPGCETFGIPAGATRHPDSCDPAAWSAGAAFGFLRAGLGLDVDPTSDRPTVEASLPPSLATVSARVHHHGRAFEVSAGSISAASEKTADAASSSAGSGERIERTAEPTTETTEESNDG